MQNKFLNIIKTGYLRYIDNREFSPEDGLSYWQERIFNGMMFVILFFGTLAIIPNIFASIASKTHLVTVTDLLIYALVLFLFYNRKMKLRYKVWFIISFIYLLSVVLLVTLGPLGPGFIWLACTSLFAALLIGMRAAIITIIVNSFIIILLAVLIHFKALNTMFFNSYTVVSWVAVSVNVLLFNVITSIPLSLIIGALEKLLNNEKQLKAELIRRNRNIENEKNLALESDRLKSAFLANLSHEIRTPMNAIVGFSELIRNETSTNDKVKRFSQHVIQNSKYLLDLINDIVDIAIIESGQVILHHQLCKLGQIFNELIPTIEASSARSKRTNVTISYSISPELLDEQVYLDGTRLKQILINLITNALKYTPEGSIEIKVEKEGEHLKFSVVDTGVGIPKNEQVKIFERFSKIDRKGKFSVPGIGLGLSITRGLCEAMGGCITFESEENYGTQFNFFLPTDVEIKSKPSKILQE